MFRRILVPTDGRPGSVEAVRVAARLARALRAEILASYVVDQSLVTRASANFRDAVRRELETEGRSALRQATSICRRAGVISREVLLSGGPAREIVTAARRAHADLLVMRTSGRGPLASWLLGSPAQSIVRRVPCPVLLVRPGTARRRPRTTRRGKRADRT